MILAGGRFVRVPPRGPALKRLAALAHVLESVPRVAGPLPDPWREALTSLESHITGRVMEQAAQEVIAALGQ